GSRGLRCDDLLRELAGALLGAACLLLEAARMLLGGAQALVGGGQSHLEIGDDAVLRATGARHRGTGFRLGQLALQTIELTAQRFFARLALAHLLLRRLPAQRISFLALLVLFLAHLLGVEAGG